MKRTFNLLRLIPLGITTTLLCLVFLVFILQIFFRYALNEPISWSIEVCLTAWVWIVFMASGFCLGDNDHVTFDMLYNAVDDRWRRIFTAVSALLVGFAFLITLPAIYDYIMFYRLKKSATLGIRLHYVFSIYGIFSLAVVANSLFRFVSVVFMKGAVKQPQEVV